ncbi:MAG: hypothetical protein GY769_14330 [bacterium]|nr:hypothetical protein [bacterium]
MQFQNNSEIVLKITDFETGITTDLPKGFIKTIDAAARPRLRFQISTGGVFHVIAHGGEIEITDQNKGSQLPDIDEK